MAEECIHEMLPESCAVCKPRQATQARATRSPAFGPWLNAFYDGTCAGCEDRIRAGDPIRSDGAGHWLCEDCGGAGPEEYPHRGEAIWHERH